MAFYHHSLLSDNSTNEKACKNIVIAMINALLSCLFLRRQMVQSMVSAAYSTGKMQAAPLHLMTFPAFCALSNI
jgi:hypothetical protein